MLRGRLVISLLLLGLAAGCTGGESGDTPRSPRAAQAEATKAVSSPPGRSASAGKLDPGKVQGDWWSWAAGAPSGRNPVEDRSGAHCAVGQAGDLWFLAGTFGGSVRRRCAVPARRTLVAPIVNLHGSANDCAGFMASASGSVTVDGRKLPVLRWNATPITVTGVEGNPVTESDGRIDTMGCGLWASSAPLAAGRHAVAIRGTSGDFRVSVDYVLTVAG
ncbi:signal protein [Actinomadura fibrosa]|uniref:Signal protein n=1 Tax=Actinomadura fibrosa TaxID=111802 RepID=A0ABW2XT06_9ACTN|nr:signal protein [Actinomadura fibrosa]